MTSWQQEKPDWQGGNGNQHLQHEDGKKHLAQWQSCYQHYYGWDTLVWYERMRQWRHEQQQQQHCHASWDSSVQWWEDFQREEEQHCLWDWP